MSRLSVAAATSHALSLTAMEEASRLGQRTTGVDHMFLALVVNEQPAGQLLRELGITLESARAAVVAQHAAQLASLGVSIDSNAEGRIVFHETGGYEWDGPSLEILRSASSNKKHGDAAAVLRELLVEPSGMVNEVLRQLGTTPESVASRLDEIERYPVHAPKNTIMPGKLSGSLEAFVPAPVNAVWELLADLARMPEWEFNIESIEADIDALDSTSSAATSWIASTRTRRLDGKLIRVKPEFQRQTIELVAREYPTLIEWRFTYPDAAHSNHRRVRIELEHAAGGTRLQLSLAWDRGTRGFARSAFGLLLRPLHRFAIWMQLSNLAGGIGRVFR